MSRLELAHPLTREEIGADPIRRLSKEWLNTGDNTILHKLKQAIHDGVHIKKVFNRFILERYKHSCLEIHFHSFRITNQRGMDANTCAVAYDRGGADVSECLSRRMVNDFQPSIGSVNRCEGKRPMLIDVHELVNDPEGMRIGARIPSAIRLQTLDECLRLTGYTTKSVFPNLPLEARCGEADGKHVVLVGGLLVDEHQLPHDVIQSRSEVMQTLANYNTQSNVRWRKAEGKPEHATLNIRISLGDNAALIETGIEIGPNSLEVFFSPDDFLPNSVEGMIHD